MIYDCLYVRGRGESKESIAVHSMAKQVVHVHDVDSPNVPVIDQEPAESSHSGRLFADASFAFLSSLVHGHCLMMANKMLPE